MKKLLLAAFVLSCAACTHAGVPEKTAGVAVYVAQAPLPSEDGGFLLHSVEGHCLYFGEVTRHSRKPNGLREYAWAIASSTDYQLHTWHMKVRGQTCKDEHGHYPVNPGEFEWDSLSPLDEHTRIVLQDEDRATPKDM